MRLLPAILLSVSVLIAALIVVSIPLFFPSSPSLGEGGAVDNTARIDVELLRADLEAQTEVVNQLRDQVDTLENRVIALESSASGEATLAGSQLSSPTGPSLGKDEYAQVVLVADRRTLNKGLTVPTPKWLIETFGPPAETLTDDCTEMTNPRLAALLEERQVGPVTVKMVRPALDSLAVVFQKIQIADPDLYSRMATAGSLCVRLVRGSDSSVSSHSFGLALDLNIDGQTDTLGDGRTQLGLTMLADFFNADGWVWGAAYGREDSMHFEVAEETIEQWIAEGKI